ncbi:hypothetical protein [Eisenibacter elegans]|jgi:hypothetical protein|uniref:hypothetical protein n=1 Tax=Eisenibacter elegans TaxID=997 RepID=UPI0004179B17|nr:hypothetical protein [Eisenibacter elegans]
MKHRKYFKWLPHSFVLFLMVGTLGLTAPSCQPNYIKARKRGASYGGGSTDKWIPKKPAKRDLAAPTGRRPRGKKK